MKALTYDVHPKHILKANGQFEYERLSNEICRCSHKQSSQLDGWGICLDKEKVELTGTCICEVFTPPNQQSTFSDIPKKRLPRKEQTEDIIVRDGKITQDDQKKFMSQYGIM